MMEIAPPPRSKRGSLPRQVSTPVIRRPPTKPPKPPQQHPQQQQLLQSTSLVIGKQNQTNNKHASQTTPPISSPTTTGLMRPSPTTTTSITTSSIGTPVAIIAAANSEDEDGDHIYESVDLRKRPQIFKKGASNDVIKTVPPNRNDLRMSTEVQCWPWLPRQASLPPPSTSPPPPSTCSTTNSPFKSPIKKSAGSLAAKTIQSIRSVSLGRGVEPPRSAPTILQRFSNLRRSLNRDRFRVQQEQPIQSQTPSSPTQPHLNSLPRRPDDPDWVFFR